ncbi:MAG TPA: DnaB-like helicase C-terminal domain-containing protein [Candidatus Limnocylindrales bacterium]|nr:DnaB-like helicase C-terminal domain-containing protein [Candidatus Limnocylindrales bacterium]
MKLRRGKPADRPEIDVDLEAPDAVDEDAPVIRADRRGRPEAAMPPLPSEPLPEPPTMGGTLKSTNGSPAHPSARSRRPREKAEPPPWRLDTESGSMAPRSSLDVLVDVNDKVLSGQLAEYEPVPLGMPPIDRTIGGGIKPGELLLIGGAQGTGKTTMALQMARNVAASGQAYVLYVCFEHDEADLLNRLISMESLLPRLPHRAGGVKIQEVRAEVLATYANAGEGMADIAANPRLRPSLERLARYGHNLFLLRGSATTATVDNLRLLIQQHRERSGDRRLLVVVDYLQKVPQLPEPESEAEKVTSVVQGLKDIALSEHVPVIAIVAADKEGLKASRLRNYHLRGSSAINYEADVILILNEKYQIVAKVNIEFNPYQAQRFRDWVIVTVEKNRAGQDNVELEYEKHFDHSCFDPTGRPVQEKLIEERLYNE